MLEGTTPQWLRGMFSSIARRYDLTNTVISAGLDQAWRRRLAEHAVRGPVRTILDVACGTGAVMAQVVQRCPPGTQVVGVDFTEAMLRRGQERLAQRVPQGMLAFCVGDAQRLPYATGGFDVLTMMFGLRNFDDPLGSLHECFRVLRAGGRIHLVEFSWPHSRVLRIVYGAYWRYLLPLLAWPLCGEWAAYRYLRDSVLAFRRQPEIATLLHHVGFVDVRTTALSGGITRLYEGWKPSATSRTGEETS